MRLSCGLYTSVFVSLDLLSHYKEEEKQEVAHKGYAPRTHSGAGIHKEV